MIKIKVNGNLDYALKLYKGKVLKSRIIQELKERSEFVKPSVKKRKNKLKAQYKQKLKDGL